ncbi:MAG TPA: hypothetical protein VKA55_05150 [Gammaproteobacteria bacterium]|nr:hypothetical protein [Gammaproteobacteria bacterium]
MRTFFVTYLGEGGAADWAEIHADTLAQAVDVAANHGWRIMSLHDTACWRPRIRVETSSRLELLELERFLHYHRRARRVDPTWLGQIRERAETLRDGPRPG